VLSLQGVSKWYQRDRPAVRDVTLRVRPGEIFGFLGPNGAGKTTTIKMIAGLFAARQRHQPVQGYSHGMRQKLALIAALLAEPALLILDEPMVGLDPKSNHRLKQLMRAYCEAGRTVFFSTHILDVAERLCDRVGIIKSGRLIAVGTLDELRSAGRDDATLESIFLELTEEPAPEAAER